MRSSDGNYEERERAMRNDPRSTQELISRVCSLDEESDERWEIIMVLHYRGDREAFRAASRLCESSSGYDRRTGADILGQLGIPERSFPDECVDTLLRLLEKERDVQVLHSIGVALGHIGSPRAIAPLCALRSHYDSEVRLAIVHGLMGHEEAQAIAALVELSSDLDDDVRNWATFALGTQVEVDTPEIRAALWRRTSDADAEVRGEALVGLSNRKDPNVWEPVLKELKLDEVEDLAVEAAGKLGDCRLYDRLLELKALNPQSSAIEEALEKCQMGK